MLTMTAPVYISSGVFDAPAFGALIDLCVEHGIYGVELGALCSASADDLRKSAGALRRGPKLLIHNYFPRPDKEFVLNLAADSDAVRTLSLNHCVKAIDICAELGIPFYSFHAGFAVDAAPGQLGKGLTEAPRFPRKKAYANFIGSLKSLCSYSSGKNVRLLVENNVVTAENLVAGRNELLLGADAGELAGMLADVNSPALGLLADVGHLKVTAKTLGFSREEFLDRLSDKIEAFHLSDNDSISDGHAAFENDAWFLPRLARFHGSAMILETQKTRLDAVAAMIGSVREVLGEKGRPV